MDGFDEANRALLVTIPSSIPKQREQFLNACGIVQKAGKRGAEGRTTAPDGVILSELMPFVKAHVSGDKFDFGTLFSTIQQKYYEPIWQRIGESVASVTLSPSFPDENAAYAQRGPSEEAATGSGADIEDRLRFLRAMAGAAQRFLEEIILPSVVKGDARRGDDGENAPAHSPILDACPSFLAAAEALNAGIYYFAGPEGILAQRAIANLCEAIWLSGLPGGEVLIPALIPYVLLASIQSDTAKEADVKRVHGLRTALTLLDIEDDSFASIKEFLMLAFCSPLYLKCAEGRRFLSFVLSLHPTLIRDAHAVIKAALPGAPAKTVEAYGEILFRAWRSSDGPCVLALEHVVMQDYMQMGVLAASPAALKICRAILDAWVSQKKQRGVDDALLRCYAPILWRSLQVANPDVRRNAALLFLDAFPLQKSDASREEGETLWQKQFDTLFSLLSDSSPCVRMVGVQGTARVLSLYWEVIPAQTNRALLVKLVDELAYDSSQACVRAAVLEGLEYLLDCPMALVPMQQLLPTLAPLLHDRAEKVRTAFLKLLQRVNTMRDLHWYEIVEQDQLLARLALDAGKPTIASRITQLLVRSYFPQGVRGVEQYKRAVKFLASTPAAALAFFSHVHEHVPVGAVTKLILVLQKGSNIALRKLCGGNTSTGAAAVGKKSAKKRNHKPETEDGDASSGEENRFEISADDSTTSKPINIDLTAKVQKCIAILWRSIDKELAKSVNCTSRDALVSAYSGTQIIDVLDALSTHCPNLSDNEDVTSPLLEMAAMLPPEAVTGMTQALWSRLSALTPNDSMAKLSSIVEVLGRWQQETQLLQAIHDSLAPTLTGSTADAAKGKRGRAVKAAPSSSTHLHPLVAIRAFDALFARDESGARTRIMTNTTKGMGTDRAVAFAAVTSLFEKAPALITARLQSALSSSGRTSQEEAEACLLLSLCCSALARTHVHAAAYSDPTTLPSGLVQLMAWCSQDALPLLSSCAGRACSPSLAPSARAAADAVCAVLGAVADAVAGGCLDDSLLSQLETVIHAPIENTLSTIPPEYTKSSEEKAVGSIGAILGSTMWSQSLRVCLQVHRSAAARTAVEEAGPVSTRATALANRFLAALVLPSPSPLLKPGDGEDQPREHYRDVLTHAKAVIVSCADLAKKNASSESLAEVVVDTLFQAYERDGVTCEDTASASADLPAVSDFGNQMVTLAFAQAPEAAVSAGLRCARVCVGGGSASPRAGFAALATVLNKCPTSLRLSPGLLEDVQSVVSSGETAWPQDARACSHLVAGLSH